jgi:hypothetical protein
MKMCEILQELKVAEKLARGLCMHLPAATEIQVLYAQWGLAAAKAWRSHANSCAVCNGVDEATALRKAGIEA